MTWKSSDRPATVADILDLAAKWLDTYDKLAQVAIPDPPATVFSTAVQEDLRFIRDFFTDNPVLDRLLYDNLVESA